MVEPALFEWDVFEMAAPIQSPAKCEVRSVLRFLNAKCERPAEIHKQIVAVYGNVMNRSGAVNCPKEGLMFTTKKKRKAIFDLWQVADFYGSGIQKLVSRLNKCLDNAGDYVEK